MGTKELKDKLLREAEFYRIKVYNIKMRFAEEDAKYKIGDIVEDQNGVHLLISTDTYDDYGMGTPSLVFNSKQLRKSDLKDMEKPKHFQVYEENIKNKIK